MPKSFRAFALSLRIAGTFVEHPTSLSRPTMLFFEGHLASSFHSWDEGTSYRVPIFADTRNEDPLNFFKAAIHSMEAFINYASLCLCICFSRMGNWDLNLIHWDSNLNYTNPPCQLALLHSTNA